MSFFFIAHISKNIFFNVIFYHLYLYYDPIFFHIRNPWVNLNQIFIFVFHFRSQKCAKIRFLKKKKNQNLKILTWQPANQVFILFSSKYHSCSKMAICIWILRSRQFQNYVLTFMNFYKKEIYIVLKFGHLKKLYSILLKNKYFFGHIVK